MPRAGAQGRTGEGGHEATPLPRRTGPDFAEFGRFLSVRRDLIPPDYRRELERTRVVAEADRLSRRCRAYVERELGNTLERLFLEFGEDPARVGPFTQSHRAVLPEGGPRSWSSTVPACAGTSSRCAPSPT